MLGHVFLCYMNFEWQYSISGSSNIHIIWCFMKKALSGSILSSETHSSSHHLSSSRNWSDLSCMKHRPLNQLSERCSVCSANQIYLCWIRFSLTAYTWTELGNTDGCSKAGCGLIQNDTSLKRVSVFKLKNTVMSSLLVPQSRQTTGKLVGGGAE